MFARDELGFGVAHVSRQDPAAGRGTSAWISFSSSALKRGGSSIIRKWPTPSIVTTLSPAESFARRSASVRACAELISTIGAPTSANRWTPFQAPRPFSAAMAIYGGAEDMSSAIRRISIGSDFGVKKLFVK